jgi:broad specificity phosphatase PhoE
LTDTGHQQAQRAGTVIGAPFVHQALVYSSPFLRTRQTLAGVLAGAGPGVAPYRVYEDPRLREVEHGYSEVEAQRAMQKTHGKFYYRFRGGESPADCYDRASNFLENMMREVDRKGIERVLIVTHGLMIRCFVMRFFWLSVEQFEMISNPHNCGVITIGARREMSHADFRTSNWGVSGMRLMTAPDFVDRSHAAGIAGAVILERGLGTGVGSVVSADELRAQGRAVPPAWNVSLEGCWIVYVTQASKALMSSTIVAVDQSTGRVLYTGSADDEG